MSERTFTEGELAIIEKAARVAAREVVDLHAPEFREQARTVAEETAKRSAELLAAQVKIESRTMVELVVDEKIEQHAKSCLVKIEAWKLLVLGIGSALGGGGFLKLLGG
jgi:hypothetical protein